MSRNPLPAEDILRIDDNLFPGGYGGDFGHGPIGPDDGYCGPGVGAQPEDQGGAVLGKIAAAGGHDLGAGGPIRPGDGDEHTAKPKTPVKPDKPVKPKDPWADRTDLIKTPTPKAPSAVKLPAIQRFKLNNGLAVIVIESHDFPTVGFRRDLGVWSQTR